MPKIRPGKVELRKILTNAAIDPNKKGNFVEQQLVEIGEPAYYETRVVEHMQEANRIRSRMLHAHGKGLDTLIELYTLTMTKALTAIAIAIGKINSGTTQAKTAKRTRGKDTGSNSSVSESP